MKILMILVAIASSSSLLFAQKTSKSFGNPFEVVDQKSVDDLGQLMKSTDSLVAVFSGTIEQSCAAKGCWMTLKSQNIQTLRVTFENYGFFVPTEGLEGKKTTFKGYCKKKETSVADLQHYAEDDGKSKDEIASITQPKVEYKFVATGVVIEE